MNSMISNLVRKLKKLHLFSQKYFLYDVFFIISIIYLYNQIDSSNLKDYKTLNNESLIEILDFEGFDNKNGLNDFIIPNIVHYLIDNQTEMSSIHLLSILSVWLYQKPSKIYIHAKEFKIKPDFLNIINILGIKSIIKIQLFKQKEKIFETKIKYKEHLYDFKRLEIMFQYGGIYLSEREILVEPINKFRKYEAVLILNDTNSYQSNIIISHKNARILNSFYDNYRKNYSANSVDFNTQFIPNKILQNHKYLAKTIKIKYLDVLITQANTEEIKLWTNPNKFMKIFEELFPIDEIKKVLIKI